ncbi:MAG: transposase, partial [Myxococcota bacterium]
RTVRLPGKVGGTFGVRESTRNLRRLLRKPGTKLRFATVTYANARWKLTVNLETGPLHRGRHVPADLEQPIVGIDRGLRCFAVVADEHGRELARIDPPRPLRARLRRLRRLSRALSRKAKGSRGRIRARRQLGRLHGHIRNIRHHALRELVSWLAKTHGHLVVETLSTRALMGTWLARSLADVGWALFELWLTTKVAWHGGTLTKAPPHFPSTQQCSQCQHRGPKVPLHQRTFRCGHCGFVADRDTNAAINLARYARSHSSASPGSLGRP